MNVCGVLVHANPSKTDRIVAALEALPGVEVHEIGSGGRIVTTVEDTQAALALDTLTAIHRLDGIVAAALVYHQFDDGSKPASVA